MAAAASRVSTFVIATSHWASKWVAGKAPVRRNTDLARQEQQPGLGSQLYTMSIN
jgi:hypothetical protein